jgi:two-component system, LuxR family, sensor kinase FixL
MASQAPLVPPSGVGPATRRLMRAENALQQRVEFESLVYRLQNHFSNLAPQYLDWGIDEALGAMGEYIRVEQAHCFRVNGDHVDHTHEWTSDGQPTAFRGIKDRSIAHLMPWAAARLRRGDGLAVFSVQQLGDAAAYERLLFNQAGVRSAVFVPMLVKGELTGFLALCSTTREVTWDGDAVSLLKTAGQEIADLHERQRAEATQAQLVGILEAAADCVTIVERATERIVYMNQAGRSMIGIEPEEDLEPWRLAHIMPPWVLQRKMQHAFPAVEGHGWWTGESAVVTRSGVELPVSESITKVPGVRGAGSADCYAFILRDISEQRRLEKEVLDIAEREQSRFGHDLHDGLGQHLTGVQFMAQVLQQKLEESGQSLAHDAAEIASLIREAITLTRDLARSLSPVVLQSKTLQDALRDLAAGICRRSAAECVTELDEDIAVTDIEGAIQLYRIAQEAVNNALKHGLAKRIIVSLQHTDDGLVELAVRDNGKGFPPGAPVGMGMGLRVMKHRAALVGGSLEIMARPHETAVICTAEEETLNRPLGPRRA